MYRCHQIIHATCVEVVAAPQLTVSRPAIDALARAADPARRCGAAAVSDPSSAAASPLSLAPRRTRAADAPRVPGIAGRGRARAR